MTAQDRPSVHRIALSAPLGRIARHWVYGGAAAAPLLLLMFPLLGFTPVQSAVFLALPVYMLHQWEEHDADRFRIYINTLLEGRKGLSHVDVAVINLIGVWALLVLTLWLASRSDPGWGAIAFWLIAFNGALHVVQAIVLRRPNPGLWTSLGLFAPLSGLLWIRLEPHANALQHVLAAGLVIGLHVAILLWARRPNPDAQEPAP